MNRKRPQQPDRVYRSPLKSDIVTRTNVLFRHLPGYLQADVDRKLRLEEEGDDSEE